MAENEMSEDVKKIIYLIAAGCMVVVTGKKEDRDNAIKQAMKNVDNTWKTVYLGSEKKYRWNISETLAKSNNLWGNMLGVIPKERVLFIEDPASLTYKNFKMIRYYYDENNLKSVVISAQDNKLVKTFPDAIRNRIGNRIINVKSM